VKKIYPRDSRLEKNNSGIFRPWLLNISGALYLPFTEEHIPPEFFDAGRLLHANSSPASPEFNNLADFYISPQNHAIELRIPWMLFNCADPSTRMFIGDLYAHEYFDIIPVKIDGIYFEPGRRESAKGSTGSVSSVKPGYYTWNEWGDYPSFHERLKKSYTIMQKKFAEY
jgi:hypothetical protein